MFQSTNTQNHFPITPATTNKEWLSATGTLLIPMTNDYLFRALLQRNNNVLKGLICSLLHLPTKKIESAVITNPIILGESINDKTFFLDVFVTLNNRTRINLEMQVINEYNWPERSLSYLCRTFDNLNSGENYSIVRPAIQIGLLDFTLFPQYPEFYSTYQFMNIKNHTVYSDKIQLSVLNLTRKDLATDEDRKHHLDHWASLFKSTSWEELKMLAKQNEFINEAASTIYQLSQEEMIRLQCEAREDYYRRQRTVQYNLDKQKDTIENQNVIIKQLMDKTASQQEEITSLQEEISSLKKLLSETLESAKSVSKQNADHKELYVNNL